jgi:hypothetical protein
VEPAPPAIDADVADRLAAASDAIADALDAGDVCTAAVRADELNAQVIEAVNAGAIPPAFQEPLTARTNELVNEVNCPQPEPEEDEEKEKKEEEKDDEEEVEPVETVELPVEPPGQQKKKKNDDDD